MSTAAYFEVGELWEDPKALFPYAREWTKAPHVARDTLSIDVEFAVLKRWLEDDTNLSSFLDSVLEHPAFKRAIQLGMSVVPAILRELQFQPTHWHLALAEITGADPVKEEHAGDLEQICADWIRWGRDQKLV